MSKESDQYILWRSGVLGVEAAWMIPQTQKTAYARLETDRMTYAVTVLYGMAWMKENIFSPW